MTETAPTLTKWQSRRRRSAAVERVVMATLFFALALAMIVYFGAIIRIISPVFPVGR